MKSRAASAMRCFMESRFERSGRSNDKHPQKLSRCSRFAIDITSRRLALRILANECVQTGMHKLVNGTDSGLRNAALAPHLAAKLRVMIDVDLAALYGVPNKLLNE